MMNERKNNEQRKKEGMEYDHMNEASRITASVACRSQLLEAVHTRWTIARHAWLTRLQIAET